jgi:serine/threonine-protein kinase
MTTVRVGEVLAGRFRIERVLGEGGMGIVLLAHHLHLDQPVAIKLLSARMDWSEDTLTRFMREARAASKIKSEQVVRVFDVATLEDGSPYIVMEYLEGLDLQRELEARGAMTIENAVDCILQACVALAEAHKLGIVHRDLKPGNLFLTHRADGSRLVKVLDFGISKVTSRDEPQEESRITRYSSQLGSPMYMSPEQMRVARDASERTDVWALGIILYQLLTGGFPFPADTVAHICAKVLDEPPEPLVGKAPGLGPEIQAVVFRCLEKEPEKRFGSVGELAEALRPFAGQSSIAYIDRAHGVLAAPARDSFAGPIPPPAQPGIWGTVASFARTRGGGRAARAGLLAAMIAGAAIGIVLFILFVVPAITTKPPAAATATASVATPATASVPATVPATSTAAATATVPATFVATGADTATIVAPGTVRAVKDAGVRAGNRPFGTQRQ